MSADLSSTVVGGGFVIGLIFGAFSLSRREMAFKFERINSG